eukprot:15483194-Alexandrium_andersonii.AAC.1
MPGKWLRHSQGKYRQQRRGAFGNSSPIAPEGGVPLAWNTGSCTARARGVRVGLGRHGHKARARAAILKRARTRARSAHMLKVSSPASHQPMFALIAHLACACICAGRCPCTCAFLPMQALCCAAVLAAVAVATEAAVSTICRRGGLLDCQMHICAVGGKESTCARTGIQRPAPAHDCLYAFRHHERTPG